MYDTFLDGFKLPCNYCDKYSCDGECRDNNYSKSELIHNIQSEINEEPEEVIE